LAEFLFGFDWQAPINAIVIIRKRILLILNGLNFQSID